MKHEPLLAICALGTLAVLVGCSSADSSSTDPSSAVGGGGSESQAEAGAGGAPSAGTGGAGTGGAQSGGAGGGSGGRGGAGARGGADGGADDAKAGGGGSGGSSPVGSDAGGTLGPPGTHTSCKGTVVYDGEPGSHPLTTSPGFQVTGWPQVTTGADATGDAAVGTHFLKVVSDPGDTCCGTLYSSWTGWDKGSDPPPIDVSKAASVQFWIRIESGQYWNLMIEVADSMKNSFTGSDVHVADYIPGNNIDSTWRQATVPMSALNTNGVNLAKLSGVIFEGDRPVTFDIDQIVFCDAAQ